ncbi:DUF6113 family protein [Streptomyces sp. GC420]|uniref:DUF6113 family protein n=1 Tax=Streptomyces sp. GC420 TaxID=2697568 RepID=UPI001414D5CC|nr:DUF6113 family protein [Streptomyces sp. GC420]NBM17209.1 hypothetical protein [Streptomyces sp. GC420]
MKTLAYGLLAVLGAAVGVAGTLVQAAWFPGGLVLALLALAGLGYGGTTATGTRVGAAVPAGAWLLAVMVMTSSRPEGDYLFGAGLGSYAYLLGGMIVAVMCATMPRLRQPGAPPVRLGR